MIGYVYIMINTAFPDLIKIGRTTKNSDDRAGELYTTGTPGKFIVVYDLLVYNCDEIEKELHAYYADKRYSNSREFFSVSTKDAIVKLQEISEGRLASTLDFDVKNTVDKELYNGDLANFFFYCSKSIFYNINSSSVSWTKSETYPLYRFGIFKSTLSNSEDLLISNLRKYYFEQGKLTHTIEGVKLITLQKINYQLINSKKQLAFERILLPTLENIIGSPDYKEKLFFVDDNQTITCSTNSAYAAHYEIQAISSKIKQSLEKYMEHEEDAYAAFERDLKNNECKKSWSGKI